MADILDKDFKTTVLKMLKKLKEAIVKVKKMMSGGILCQSSG